MPGLTDAELSGAREAVEQILNSEPEPDEALRRVVSTLHDQLRHFARVGLYFVDAGELILGPASGRGSADTPRLPIDAGTIGTAVRTQSSQVANTVDAADACVPWAGAELAVPVMFDGQTVAAIAVDAEEPGAFGDDERRFVERVAALISAHCLVGWDTGGVPWSDVV
jgi:putative methionine-R-sulfoxide reductase with GAF domain